MPTAKDVILRPISAQDANALVRRVHYSGKVVNNSQLHIGAFLNGKLEGAISFGPSLDKRKLQGLVEGTGWNEFIELNRMAFTDALPRNSESRALAVAMRLLRKHAPHLKWVVTFADATQCGDGTIYRAAGFVLTSIAESQKLFRLPSGVVVHLVTLESNPTTPRGELGGRTYFDVTDGRFNPRDYLRSTGAKRTVGYQLRYLYFLDPTARERLTVPILPYADIERRGAAMYRGLARPRSVDSDATAIQAGEDGATPILGLHDDRRAVLATAHAEAAD